MEEVEVEVLHLTFLQLGLEDLRHLVHVGQVVAGEFVSQIEALPGVGGQRLADGQLRVAAVVAPGSIVVVDAVRHGVGYHLLHRRLVYLVVLPIHHRQTHAAHAQGGQLQILKCFIDHGLFHPFL